MTQARLKELEALTEKTVECSHCLGKGFTESHALERDPKCPHCIKGRVPQHTEILELLTEVMRLRYLLKHAESAHI